MNAPCSFRPRLGQQVGAPPPTHQAASLHEKLLSGRAGDLSNQDLVAVLLGHPDQHGIAIAARLLVDNSLGRLIPCRASELRHYGVSSNGSATLLAAYELARRLTAQEIDTNSAILNRPEVVARYLLLHHMAAVDQEVLGALYLDVRHRPLATAEIFRGTLHRAAVEPRPILREALLLGAASVIVFHTHPSGDPTPSHEDFLFTQRLASACSLLGIDLRDHLIVTHTRRWISLRAGSPSIFS
jgi:DNA repair protein RadC